MTAAGLASQVLDVSSADLRDPQPVEQQETYDRLGLRILCSDGEERPDVVLGDRPTARFAVPPRVSERRWPRRTGGRPFAADRPSGPISSASQLR